MLNTAPIAAQSLPNPAPGVNANAAGDATDTPAFAQVLGQAAAEQRAAHPDSGKREDADAASDRRHHADVSSKGERPAAGAVRGKAQHLLAKPDDPAALRSSAKPDASARPPAEPDASARPPVAPDTSARPPVAPDARIEPIDGAGSDGAAQAMVDLAQWVSGLPLPPAPRADTANALSPQGEPSTTTGPAVTAAAGQALKRAANDLPGPDARRGSAADTPVARGPERRDLVAAPPSSREAGAAAIDTRFAAEAAVQGFGRAPAAKPHEGPPDNPGSIAALPPAGGSVSAIAAAAAPPALLADIHVPPGSREFAPALGAQLAVLVRDGIEHAQLRLNPAELGPIDVRITLDGTQAQVDFTAAHASTRQALQDAVPTLAGALRESGLTLSGGGIFEQPHDRRGDARPDAPRSDAAIDVGPREAVDLISSALSRLPRARGVVDLYA